MVNSFQILIPRIVASRLHGNDDKPSMSGINFFMEHWQNLSLENISQVIDGVIYNEVWEEVINYEKLYQISSFGRLKGLYREYRRGRQKQLYILEERIMKGWQTPDGYIMFSLCKNGKEEKIFSHVLTATYFLPITDIKNATVDHISTIKYHNHFTNLQWLTRQQNSLRALLMGNSGAAFPKFTDDQVLKIFNDKRSQSVLCKEYGVHNTTISLIKTGKHYSYVTGKKYIQKRKIKQL